MPLPAEWEALIDAYLDLQAEKRRASRDFWRAFAAMEPEPLWPDDRKAHQVTAETLNRMKGK